MKDEEKQYWDTVEQFIESANSLSKKIDLGIVSAALIHSAARYASYNMAATAADGEDLNLDKDEIIRHHTSQFKRLFAENLEDYIENYQLYLSK